MKNLLIFSLIALSGMVFQSFTSKEYSAKLSDDAIVVRVGDCSVEQFANDAGAKVDTEGKLQGVAVISKDGASLEELSEGVEDGQFGHTTVGEVRALGGDVVVSPTDANPNHAVLSGITAEQAHSLFAASTESPSE